MKTFFFFFFFFLESSTALVSLASRESVLGLGFFCVLGLEPCVLDSTSDSLTAESCLQQPFFVSDDTALVNQSVDELRMLN